MAIAKQGIVLATTLVWCAISGSAQASDPAGLAYLEHPRTLSSVARRFHLSVAEIATLNGIKDPDHFHAAGLVLPDVLSTRTLPRYVPWRTAATLQTCATSQPWVLRETPKREGSGAYCASGAVGDEVCVQRDDDENAHLELTAPGKKTFRVPIFLSAFNPFGASMVDIVSVDLDGDGKPETIVSWLTSVSNGLAQENRTLMVLAADHDSELVRYDSGYFSARDAVVRVDGECHLASSHYEEVSHPLRGLALYRVERTFDPIKLRMDTTLVGARVAEPTRYILPHDPLAPKPVPRLQHVRAGSDARVGDAHNRRVFPPDLASSKLKTRPFTIEHNAEVNVDVLWR